MSTASKVAFASLCLIGCGDPDCPPGSEFDGTRCVTLDGGVDAGLGDSGVDAIVASDGGAVVDSSTDTSMAGRCEPDCDLVIACRTTGPTEGLGATVSVEWTASNLNTTGSAGAFDVIFELWRSDTTMFEAIGNERHPALLGPADMVTRITDLTVPGWVVDGVELRCVADAGDEVAEANETNNDDTTMLAVTGLPDLTIERASVPLRPNAVLVDSMYFRVMFDLVNAGEMMALATPWHIAGGCMAGGGTLASGDAGPVAAGERTTVMARAYVDTVPCSGSGDVTVRADPMMFVTESDDTNNGHTTAVDWD